MKLTEPGEVSAAVKADENLKFQPHDQWRKQHPADHPLWCRLMVTGKLEPCDCDLTYPPQSDAAAAKEIIR